jgi:hypothetical protein
VVEQGVVAGKKGKSQKRRNHSTDPLLTPADVTFSNLNPKGAKARLEKYYQIALTVPNRSVRGKRHYLKKAKNMMGMHEDEDDVDSADERQEDLKEYHVDGYHPVHIG